MTNAETKTCIVCNETKTLDLFMAKTTKCRICMNKYKWEWSQSPEQKAKRKECSRLWNLRNGKAHREKRKDYNREYLNVYLKNKRATDVNYRLRHSLRNRINRVVKVKFKGGSAVKDIGCSLEQLRLHLEAQFSDVMSWDNYGKVWSIDHIKPLAIFDLTLPKDCKTVMHYSNLQPLLVEENSRKAARVIL